MRSLYHSVAFGSSGYGHRDSEPQGMLNCRHELVFKCYSPVSRDFHWEPFRSQSCMSARAVSAAVVPFTGMKTVALVILHVADNTYMKSPRRERSKGPTWSIWPSVQALDDLA